MAGESGGVKLVRLDQIRIDGDTQTRVAVDEDVVAEYAVTYEQEISGGEARLPPVECVWDGVSYWLWDGYHRYHAAGKAGAAEVPVRWRPGTLQDARWLACGANTAHGLRRTNADKRRAVEMALAMHPEGSDRAIADHCGVSSPTVARVRAALVSVKVLQMEGDSRTVTRGGTTYQQDTSNIGKRQDADTPSNGNARRDSGDAGAAPEPETGGGSPTRSRKAEETPPPARSTDVAVKDQLGAPVPAHLRDLFADPKLADEIEAVRRWRSALQWEGSARRVASIAPYNAHLRHKAHAYREHLADAAAALAAAEQVLADSLPCALCPRCGGADGGCGACSSAGWVPRSQYDRLGEYAAFEEGAA